MSLWDMAMEGIGERYMKVITFDDIKRLDIAPKTCYQWVSEMIGDKKSVLLPPKISMKPADGIFCNIMPCILGKSQMGGVKAVTRYPGREPSLDSRLLLADMETGSFLALMDANWITAMRTGAVAVHSIILLSKKGFSEIGMFGLGNVARAVLLILAEVMPEREFHIKLLRYKGQEEAFAARFSRYGNFHFRYVEDVGTLVKDTEVIVSAATYLPQDICSAGEFGQGVLVAPIHTLGFKGCDLCFDKVYADDYYHVCHFEHFKEFKQFAEISDVVNGKAAGREGDAERILVYNIGIAMHDIYFAAHIYQMLKDKDGLIDVDMHGPMEKFWI